MKKITVDQIMSWGPCPDYTESRVSEIIDDGVTLLDALYLNIPDGDILWLVLRPDFMPRNDLHEHGCHFAEETLISERAEGREPHQDSWGGIIAKRGWIRGEITDKELKSAALAAWAAERAERAELAAEWTASAAYIAASAATLATEGASAADDAGAYWIAAAWAASRAASAAASAAARAAVRNKQLRYLRDYHRAAK